MPMPKNKANKIFRKKTAIRLPVEQVPISKKKRIPQEGDRVAALGHSGTFVVSYEG
jgi:hypothetical protein